MYVGALPAPVVPLTALTANVEDMAVDAGLTGNPELVYQAVANSPLSASVLSLQEIKKMVKALLKKNHDYLPQFKTIDF